MGSVEGTDYGHKTADERPKAYRQRFVFLVGNVVVVIVAAVKSRRLGGVLAPLREKRWRRSKPALAFFHWAIHRLNPILRFWLEAGLLEDHRDASITSVLRASRQLRNVLTARGYSVRYHEFAGGHQYINRRGTLPDALVTLLGPQLTDSWLASDDNSHVINKRRP